MMTLLFAAAVAAVSPPTSGQHPHAAIAPGGYGFQLFVPRDVQPDRQMRGLAGR